MKKSVLAILAIFFSFFVFSPTALAQESGMLDPRNDPWDSVMSVRVVEDEWGCQNQSGFSTQYMRVVERRVCPQYIDEFYEGLSESQIEKAIQIGLSLLNPGFAERYPEKWRKVAMSKFFREITGKS